MHACIIPFIRTIFRSLIHLFVHFMCIYSFMSAVCATGVVGDDTFREGVVSGFLLILFSELGDKTFFIALLLALKQSQALVFAGTFGALAVMTVISVRRGCTFIELGFGLKQLQALVFAGTFGALAVMTVILVRACPARLTTLGMPNANLI